MKISRFKLTLLLIGIMLAMMQCMPVPFGILSVNRVVVIGNIPYLYVLQNNAETDSNNKVDTGLYFVSLDDGASWQESQSISVENPSIIKNPSESQITQCVPKNTQLCYRTTGKEIIEVSFDGGQNWQIDWEMPKGRGVYQARNPRVKNYGIPDTVPYDIGIVVTKAGHVVIVPMGNQGIIVKDENGNWNRITIRGDLGGGQYPAMPVPYFASNFEEATSYIETEFFWFSLLSIIYFAIFSLIIWSRIRKRVDGKYHARIKYSFAPFIISVIGLILFTGVALYLANNSEGYHPKLEALVDSLLGGTLLSCLFPFLGVFLSWTIIIAILPGWKNTLQIGLICLGFSILFWVSIYPPFILWAYGIIPIYSISLGIAAILGISVVWIANKIQKQIADQVIKNLE